MSDALTHLSIETLILPDTITTIGGAAFLNCENLTAISLPGAIEIGNAAFCGCVSLINVSLPKVKVIGREAFFNCEKLSQLDLGNGLEEVGEYAFENCNSLTEITLPASIKSLGLGSLRINAESVSVKFYGEMSQLDGEIRWAQIAASESTAKSFKFECMDGVIWIIGGPIE